MKIVVHTGLRDSSCAYFEIHIFAQIYTSGPCPRLVATCSGMCELAMFVLSTIFWPVAGSGGQTVNLTHQLKGSGL